MTPPAPSILPYDLIRNQITNEATYFYRNYGGLDPRREGEDARMSKPVQVHDMITPNVTRLKDLFFTF